MVIRVGRVFSEILDLKTSNGGIRVEGEPMFRILQSERDHIRLALGESKTPSLARTSNGWITFGMIR